MNAMTMSEMVAGLSADEAYLFQCEMEAVRAQFGSVSTLDREAWLTKHYASKTNIEIGKARILARTKAKQAAKLAQATGRAGSR